MSGSQKRVYLSPPHMGGKEREFLLEAFDSNWIAPLGPQVDAFEREFIEHTGLPHAVALASGTVALHLALRIINVERGDKVITPSLTFVGGVSPIVFQGAEPVFVDSERKSWNIDPELVAEEVEACSRRGAPPKAIISADIYGQCADMDALLYVCNKYEIFLISDSAEAMGATYKGRHAGFGAKLAIFSFNGNKIITTSGGGMLASEDRDLIEEAKNLSQQARDPAPHYEHSRIGYNYRMSNVLAGIGRGQLRVLDERVRRRREIFQYYREELGGMPGIEFMPEADWGRATRWLTVILVTPAEFGCDREEIRMALEKENIESRPAWKPMHMQPVFRGNRMRGGKVCEDIFKRGLCLPSGTAMTEGDLGRIVEVIKSAGRRGR